MCTSIFMKYNEDNVPSGNLTTRTLDWHTHLKSSVWAFPKEKGRFSLKEGEKGRIFWEAKYASLGVCQVGEIDGKEIGFNDSGINDQGLVVSSLWLSEAKYDLSNCSENTKNIAATIWVQYMLDNYKDVSEAVIDWAIDDYKIVATKTLGETEKSSYSKTLGHLFLTDANGNSAVFEYYDINEGNDKKESDIKLVITTNIKLKDLVKNLKETKKQEEIKEKQDLTNLKNVIIKNEDCLVLTNSPVYEKQLELNYYWRKRSQDEKTGNFDALTLPGTNTSPDRFSRMDYYLNNSKLEGKPSIAQAFSLMKVVASPINYIRAKENIEKDQKEVILTTLWTSVFDNNNKKLYLSSSFQPAIYWCELKGFWNDNSKDVRYFVIDDEKFDIENVNGGSILNNMISIGDDDFPFEL